MTNLQRSISERWSETTNLFLRFHRSFLFSASRNLQIVQLLLSELRRTAVSLETAQTLDFAKILHIQLALSLFTLSVSLVLSFFFSSLHLSPSIVLLGVPSAEAVALLAFVNRLIQIFPSLNQSVCFTEELGFYVPGPGITITDVTYK